MNHSALLLTATPSAGVLVEELIWNAAVCVAAIVALVRILRLPAARWAHRYWSKAAWIAAVVWGNWKLGLVVIPVGTIAAIWHTRTIAKAPYDDRPPVPDIPAAKSNVDAAAETSRPDQNKEEQ